MASDKEKDIEALNNEEGENQEKKGKMKYGKSKDTEFGYYKDSVFSKVKYRDKAALVNVAGAIKELNDNANALKNLIEQDGSSLENASTQCGNVSASLSKLSEKIAEAIKKNNDDPSTGEISKKGDTAKIKDCTEKLAKYFELLSESKEGQEKSIGDYVKSAALSKVIKEFVKKSSKLDSDALIYFQGKTLNEAAVVTEECFNKANAILGIV